MRRDQRGKLLWRSIGSHWLRRAELAEEQARASRDLASPAISAYEQQEEEKKEFPLVYERVVAWFQAERAHGHTVLQRHLAWKYSHFLQEEISRLEDEIRKPDQLDKDIRRLKNQLDKAKKQDQALKKSSKNMDKRGQQLVKWMCAKIRKPNLETQLSAVEQQVRAELSWHYFDWQLHRMISGDEAQLKKMFSKPAEAMRSMKQAVIRCSDQVPIWIKKPSEREVFGEWEIRTSGRKIEAVRRKLGEQLSKVAQKKGIKNAEEKDEPVEQKDAQIVEHQQEEEEDEAWHLPNPLETEEGKDHTTTMREANCDKYRITFEAHQMITGFFDPDATPSGHCMKGIIIVTGCPTQRYQTLGLLIIGVPALPQKGLRHQWGQWGFTTWGVRLFICGGDRAQGG